MSRRVQIDFEGLSITVQAQCEVAEHSLCKIDKTLNKIEETAKTLMYDNVQQYKDSLIEAKENISKEIKKFYKQLEEYKKLGTYDGVEEDTEARRKAELEMKIKQEGDKLSSLVENLTGAKLEVINEMIENNLLEAGSVAYKKLQDKANGVYSFDEELLAKINAIEDVSLRELVYFEMREDKEGLNYNELLSRGKKKYDELLNGAKERIIVENETTLKANGVSSDVIKEFKDAAFNENIINKVNAKVNNSILDEKIRKETLKVIIKAIRDRGFIVDTKNNLKIDRTKNVVKLVAKKADGKTAEFEIQLNGKFMYHFDGYEGMACKKDIEPFMKDLENIYGINVLHEEVISSNPDKISTQKYQHINYNKGIK